MQVIFLHSRLAQIFSILKHKILSLTFKNFLKFFFVKIEIIIRLKKKRQKILDFFWGGGGKYDTFITNGKIFNQNKK